jgi:hypothetical protein
MQTVKFTAEQILDLSIVEQDIPIRHYLRQPHRLVRALVDPTRIQQRGDDLFSLQMRPIDFLAFKLQPTVEIKVWTDKDGILNLRSTSCEIRGIDYIDRRFSLDLVGKLEAIPVNGSTRLQGRADLQIKVDLPPALWLTPKPMVEAAGHALLKSVLMSVERRLSDRLVTDYNNWASSSEQKIAYRLPNTTKPIDL